MESVPHFNGGRKSSCLPERRAGGARHHNGKLLGTRQTNLSQRPDRVAKPWRPPMVQEYLYPGDSTPEEVKKPNHGWTKINTKISPSPSPRETVWQTIARSVWSAP